LSVFIGDHRKEVVGPEADGRADTTGPDGEVRHHTGVLGPGLTTSLVPGFETIVVLHFVLPCLGG
jgi:hypothetical protein